jgi:hypothetical protein
MAPFVERRYVFTGNGAFVCKTNVGQHTAPDGTSPWAASAEPAALPPAVEPPAGRLVARRGSRRRP